MEKQNIEINTNSNVTSSEKNITMADIEVIDKNLSLWGKIKTGQFSIDSNIVEKKFKIACISILPTLIMIAMVICDYNINMSDFGHNVVAIVAVVAILIAIILNLISAPLRLITTPIRWGFKWMIAGTIIPFFGNIFGAAIGFVLGIYTVVFFPLIITVPFLYKKMRGI